MRLLKFARVCLCFAVRFSLGVGGGVRLCTCQKGVAGLLSRWKQYFYNAQYQEQVVIAEREKGKHFCYKPDEVLENFDSVRKLEKHESPGKIGRVGKYDWNTVHNFELFEIITFYKLSLMLKFYFTYCTAWYCYCFELQ